MDTHWTSTSSVPLSTISYAFARTAPGFDGLVPILLHIGICGNGWCIAINLFSYQTTQGGNSVTQRKLYLFSSIRPSSAPSMRRSAPSTFHTILFLSAAKGVNLRLSVHLCNKCIKLSACHKLGKWWLVCAIPHWCTDKQVPLLHSPGALLQACQSSVMRHLARPSTLILRDRATVFKSSCEYSKATVLLPLPKHRKAPYHKACYQACQNQICP